MSTNKTTGKLQSLRVRLALFYAALITVALLLFGAAVYAAAVISEAEENEPKPIKRWSSMRSVGGCSWHWALASRRVCLSRRQAALG